MCVCLRERERVGGGESKGGKGGGREGGSTRKRVCVRFSFRRGEWGGKTSGGGGKVKGRERALS